LAKDPQHVSKLREEIAPVVEPSGEVSNFKLQYLDHLNAIINETLRLHPPVPTAIPRLTPPEGITIGDTYVPGNITVWCPPYVLGRSQYNKSIKQCTFPRLRTLIPQLDEEIYANAKMFIPERWYSKPELVKEKSAFSPFATGPYGCIGKPLALMQIRTIVAKIIMAFNVRFADGEDGVNLLEKSRDHFTLGLADLNLVFEKR
jgi:cytochrome P450